jgi:hypothetical protein
MQQSKRSNAATALQSLSGLHREGILGEQLSPLGLPYLMCCDSSEAGMSFSATETL